MDRGYKFYVGVKENPKDKDFKEVTIYIRSKKKPEEITSYNATSLDIGSGKTMFALENQTEKKEIRVEFSEADGAPKSKQRIAQEIKETIEKAIREWGGPTKISPLNKALDEAGLFDNPQKKQLREGNSIDLHVADFQASKIDATIEANKGFIRLAMGISDYAASYIFDKDQMELLKDARPHLTVDPKEMPRGLILSAENAIEQKDFESAAGKVGKVLKLYDKALELYEKHKPVLDKEIEKAKKAGDEKKLDFYESVLQIKDKIPELSVRLRDIEKNLIELARENQRGAGQGR